MSIAGVQPLSMFFRFDISLVGVKNDGKNKLPPVDSGIRGSVGDFDALDAGPAERGAFDNWLNQKLALLYGPVLREPIPDELVELIETHQAQKKDG